MPSLTDADKESIKRLVPKPSNKIHAVAVARLYIAHPQRQKWLHTGLQGAAVLANDLVGNTYWIKLVDISGSNRGVLWDQEIYDPFYYNQDRTFFHSFELENCLAGLSFASEKEAKKFKQKVDEREKNASKETRNTPFQGLGQAPSASASNSKSHSRFGLGNLLHGSQRHSSAPSVPLPQTQAPPPSQGSGLPLPDDPSRNRASSLDATDPSLQQVLAELRDLGIPEDQISENQDFINSYMEMRKAGNELPATPLSNGGRAKPPPPPSGPPPGRLDSLSSQSAGNPPISKRGPAPVPPQPRRSRPENPAPSLPSRQSPSPHEDHETTPPRSQYQFKAPPPIADAGKFANAIGTGLSKRSGDKTGVANPGPPPPPRPPKTPLEDGGEPKPKFGVPPPYQGDSTHPAAAPPPPPGRPPPVSAPRSKDTKSSHAVAPAGLAPPLPPKQNPASTSSSAGPTLPPTRNVVAPVPPPLPSAPRAPPSASQSISAPPPAPPLPSGGAPPPPPPPPPMPTSSGPPPPPLPPGVGSGAAPADPNTGGRADMLASIRGSGGSGGLKKVAEQDKKDRSAAMVPGSETTSNAAASSAAPSGGDGGLQGALQAALNKRNKKVAGSDDEDDHDDDW